jgi:hypothetical protein
VKEESDVISGGFNLKRTGLFLVLGVLLCALLSGCGGEQTESLLLEMLETLPASTERVVFTDLEAMRGHFGIVEEQTLDELQEEHRVAFLSALDTPGLCPTLAAYLDAGSTHLDAGYDLMEVKQCIEGDGVLVLKGLFFPDHTADELATLGYEEVGVHEGRRLYAVDPTGYWGEEEQLALAERYGYVCGLEGFVVMAESAERLQAALDVHAEREEALAQEATYETLGREAGRVVNAVFWTTAEGVRGVAHEVDVDKEAIVSARPVGPCQSREHTQTAWSVLEDLEVTRYIVLVGTYRDAQEAETEGERLMETLQTGPLARHWQEPGEVSVGRMRGGRLLTLRTPLRDDTPAGIAPELLTLWP